MKPRALGKITRWALLGTVALGGCALEISSAKASTGAEVEPETTVMESTAAVPEEPAPARATYAVRGVVRGVNAIGLVLEDNGGDAIALSKEGIFFFPIKLATGDRYAVTVAQEPEGETCLVIDGAGTVDEADVFPITVGCVTNAITVGGTIRGLQGNVLLGNAGDVVSVVGDGRFFMTTKLGPGQPYRVSVVEQPSAPPQRCEVQNGAGTTESSDVRDVRVACTPL